jgi:DNA-binding LacI/PurR family transcriptional regulator
VFGAAKALNYNADPHARSMRTGRSEMIGLVLRPRFAATGTEEVSETFNRLAGSIATECLRRGIGLVHVPDPTRPEHSTVPMDGCIIAHPYASDPIIDFFAARDIPLVYLDPDPDRPELPWTVTVDYDSGMRETFAALGQSSPQRVWLLPGTEDNAWNREAQRVYAQWCKDSRIDENVHAISESLLPAETEARISQLISDYGAPDAIVYSLSKSTASILLALESAGLRVPEDLVLATLTDSSPSRISRPPITALDLNHEGLASAAVDLMMKQLDGEDPPAGIVRVSPVVNVRASTCS